MTTTTATPEPIGILCLALRSFDEDGRPAGCLKSATVWRVEDDGAQWPVCDEHRPPAETKPEPAGAIVGELHVHETTAEQLRLSALSEAVTASTSHMSTEDPDETVQRARTFYAFLASEETSYVLTPEEAGHAADWHDWVVDQGGEVPDDERELAVRLRDVQAEGTR